MQVVLVLTGLETQMLSARAPGPWVSASSINTVVTVWTGWASRALRACWSVAAPVTCALYEASAMSMARLRCSQSAPSRPVLGPIVLSSPGSS